MASLRDKVARSAERGPVGPDLGKLSHAERNKVLFGSPIAERALALLERFANSPAYGACAGETHCQMTVERALIEEAQALIAESRGEQ